MKLLFENGFKKLKAKKDFTRIKFGTRTKWNCAQKKLINAIPINL